MRWWIAGTAVLLVGLGGFLTADRFGPPRQKVISTPDRPVGINKTDGDYDWGSASMSNDADFAASRRLCQLVQDLRPPATDLPNAEQRQSLKGCDSEALYYGFGMSSDKVRARQCAFVESESDFTVWGFYGRAMLMTIYANGEGARRNLNLAIHYACTMENAAPFERHARVLRLASMANQPEPDKFSYCDDITAGASGGACAAHKAKYADDEREFKIGELASGWSTKSRAAFARLRAAQAAFADARGLEQDLSGTLRGAFVVEHVQEDADAFFDMLDRLSKGTEPAYGQGSARAADDRLNRLYRAALAAEALDRQNVEADTVREAQRAWIAYRDAFVAFAAIQFPSVSREGIAAWVTDQRAKQLGDLVATH